MNQSHTPFSASGEPEHDDMNPHDEQRAMDDRVVDLADQIMGRDEIVIESAQPAPADPAVMYEEQIAELKDQLIRAVAETDNVRKRAQRDIEETNKFAITGFARQLVSVLENLQRATSSIPQEMRAENANVKNLADGVEMTLRELITVFDRFGIRRIDPLGEKFDHNMHQAMNQIEDASCEPGTVLQVLQAGYMIHDRLLQPALVSVSIRGDMPKQVDTQA